MRTKLRTLYEPMITYGSNPANDYSVATSKQEKNVIDFKQKVYPLAQSFPRISQTSLLQKLAIILHYILSPPAVRVQQASHIYTQRREPQINTTRAMRFTGTKKGHVCEVFLPSGQMNWVRPPVGNTCLM